jgi:hypothetical protein
VLHLVRDLSAHLSQALAKRRRAISFEVELTGPILIRYSRDDDHVALERLAALDSRMLPEGPFLLAEVHGELVAAAPLDRDAEPLSDPFVPTANVRQLLKLRARQVGRSRVAAARTVGTAPHAVRDTV